MRALMRIGLVAFFLIISCSLTFADGVVVAKNAKQPQVAVGSDGSAVVVFVREGNIQFVRSEDNGKTWTEPATAIDANGKARGAKRRGPRVGIDGAGTIHVTAPLCFNEAEFSRKFPRNELWYAQSADGGKSWSDKVRINEVDLKAAESLHWMAVSEDGVVHVSWMDARDGGINCYYSRVADGKVDRNRMVFEAPCPCCAPALTLDAKGNPIIGIRDTSSGGRKTVLMRSSNGGDSFKKAQPVHKRPSNVDT